MKDAAFDSHGEEHSATCLEDTRVDLLTQISQWIDGDESKTIFWLNGMAGTGKSTISRTVARILCRKGKLGASFFFKRGYADRGSAAKFCTTIARQLVLSRKSLGSLIQTAVEKDPDIGNKGLKIQFEKLIEEPFANAAKRQSTGNSVITIIVDALDECDSEQNIRLLISLFAQMGKLHNIKLRVFLTSRPELPIRLGFSYVTGTFQDFILHEIPQPVIEHDISVFFRHEMRRIVHEWNNSVAESRRLPATWPGEDNLCILIERAIPLFIFAATMCRFISDRNGSPKTRLDRILGSASWAVGDRMQATYAPVLEQLLTGLSADGRTDAIQEFKLIVGAIVVLESPLSVVVLSQLLGIDQDRIHDRLDKLHSVLDIPESPETPVRLFHLSFRDYLINKESYPVNEFTIDQKETSRKLSVECLRVMKAHLKTDICDLRHPGTARVDITSQHINSHLPPEVQYACLYWVKHQQVAGGEPADIQVIMDFLKIHLLHWIEALILLDRSWEISGLLKTLRIVCQVGLSAKMSLEIRSRSLFQNDFPSIAFLEDALRILNFSISTTDTHPLQLYSHALLFAPKNSLVRLDFITEIPKWINTAPEVVLDWNSCLRVVSKPDYSRVNSIRFVPNTTQLFVSLLSGFDVLDWDTGQCLQTFRDTSSDFPVLSPDGKFIALGTRGSTEIRALQTGEILGKLPKGCNMPGLSALYLNFCFSPNSKLLSVSTEESSQVWDWKASTCLLRTDRCSHIGRMKSQFSADSTLSISYSCPNTCTTPFGAVYHVLKIWNCLNGKCVFERRIQSVPSFMFTPNGRAFIFQSLESEIEVWSTSAFRRIRKFPIIPSIFGSRCEFRVSPDSKVFAIAAPQQPIQILSLVADQPVSCLHLNQHKLVTFRFLQDSRHLIVVVDNGEFQIWSISTKSKVGVLNWHCKIPRFNIMDSLDLSMDSTTMMFALSTGFQIHIHNWERDLMDSNLEYGMQRSDHGIDIIVLSPDAAKVAVGHYDTARIYDMTLGTPVWLFDIKTRSHGVDIFSPDSMFVIVERRNGWVSVHDASTGDCVWNSSTKGRPYEYSFSSDSQWLMVTMLPKEHSDTRDARILVSKKIGDTFKLKCILTKEGCRTFHSTKFCPNARFIATLVPESCMILVWDLKRLPNEPYMFKHFAENFALSQSFLTAVSVSGKTDIWHVESGRLYASGEAIINQHLFSPSERFLAIELNASVTILDWRTGTSLVRIDGAMPQYTIKDLFSLRENRRFSFLPGDAGIRTQLGIVDTREILTSRTSPHTEQILFNPLLNINLETSWVQWRGKNLLKLPAEYDVGKAVFSGTTLLVPVQSLGLVTINFTENGLSDVLLDKHAQRLFTEEG